MSRRSRSNRPRKARGSEAPPPEAAVATKTVEPVDGLETRPAPSAPVDELAALDAGWDDPP